ncbi:SacI homology domain-containing protein [Jimgerdemannia flammicorona]|nr:SacI homology domain-containing protein [Jimgerdemannia flammicorona]
MQSVILVRDNPRSLALRPAVIGVDTPSVLIFEQHAEDYYRPSYPRCTVKLARPHEFDLSKYIYLNSRPVFGCLGLIHISNDIFLAVVTDCQHIGRIRPGEEVYRIQSVSFYSLSSNVYDDLDLGYKNDAWDDEASEQNPQAVQHPCAQLQKLFASGSFYFSPDFDLTRTVQARCCIDPNQCLGAL